jgi:hypothetical protein
MFRKRLNPISLSGCFDAGTDFFLAGYSNGTATTAKGTASDTAGGADADAGDLA